MSLILIVIVLIVLFGGGGSYYYGQSNGWGMGHYGGSLGTILIVCLIVWLLFGRGGGL